MFSEALIKRICNQYDIMCETIGECIDTTKSESDQRYNYEINEAYFLKITNVSTISEAYLRDIEQLINNYTEIGVYCPRLIESNLNQLSHVLNVEGLTYTCYFEEKSKYPVSSPRTEVDYKFIKAVLKHVGILASHYTNSNLSKTPSMWSLMESDELDEKQENMNDLLSCLKSNDYIELHNKLLTANNQWREKIKVYMSKLPRCVYQGDLNNSNILVDDKGTFKGLIDFNLAGTEVNINCFLNEAMYFMKPSDFKDYTAIELYDRVKSIQEELLESITESYVLNQNELEIMTEYNKIIYTSFWPNTLLMISLLSEGPLAHKVIEFLELLL